MGHGLTPTRAAERYEERYHERFRPEAFGMLYKKHRGRSPVQERQRDPYFDTWTLNDHRGQYYAGLLRAVWRAERGRAVTESWRSVLSSTRTYLDGENPAGVPLVIDYQPWDDNVFVYVEKVPGDTDWTHVPSPGERKRIGPKAGK